MNEQIESTQPETGVAAAGPSELDALRTENASLRQTVRVAAAKQVITAALERLDAASPELLFASAKDNLQFDEAGIPTNVEALVASLRRKYPEQFGSEPFSAGTIDAGAGGSSPQRLTREALSRMTPTEIAGLDWNDVKRVLAS